MVEISLSQNVCDRLHEIRDQLYDWREYAREKPVGYTNRIFGFRFGLLSIARDFGRRVQVLLADALRSITDDRVEYVVVRDEILMISDRLGLIVDLLDREFGIYDRSDDGIRLTMQLRLQAHLLACHMTIPVVQLLEIDREDYRREYSDDIDRDTIFDRLAEMADTSSDSDDWWANLDGERIRASLSQEIPAFERRLQALSELVESLSVPQATPNGQDEITAEVPQTGTDWSPSVQPDSDEVPSVESHQCAAVLAEPNPMSSASSSVENGQDEITAEVPQTGTDWSPSEQPDSDEVPSVESQQCAAAAQVVPNPASSFSSNAQDEKSTELSQQDTDASPCAQPEAALDNPCDTESDARRDRGIGGEADIEDSPVQFKEGNASKPKTTDKDLKRRFEEDPHIFLSCLSETKIAVFLALLDGPAPRGVIHELMKKFGAELELNSLTNLLVELSKGSLIEYVTNKHWKIDPKVAEYLKTGDNLPEKVLRVRDSCAG